MMAAQPRRMCSSGLEASEMMYSVASELQEHRPELRELGEVGDSDDHSALREGMLQTSSASSRTSSTGSEANSR